MEKFTVRAEYGPTAFDNMQRHYWASSKENAVKMYVSRLKKEHKWLWENRIGYSNLYVMTGWAK